MKRGAPGKIEYSSDSESGDDSSDDDDYEEQMNDLWLKKNAPEARDDEDQGQDMDLQYEWSRPEAAVVDCMTNDFLFQHVDTTCSVVEKPGVDFVPEIRLWGVTEQGNSVVVRIDDFKPYFCVLLNPSLDPYDVFEKLNDYMRIKCNGNKRLRVKNKYVISYQQCDIMSIMGWHKSNAPQIGYKVTMALPGHVSKARKALEYGNKSVCPGTVNPTYEANIPFVLRYMVDKRMGGCQWLNLKSGMYTANPAATRRVQYDFRCSWNNVDTVEKDEIAPMRILSFDIEALKRGRGFPDAKHDSAITICAALEQVNHGIVDKVVFTTVPNPKKDGCTPVQNARTYVCATEKDMLLAFRKYVVQCDPDVFTGYNIDGFDFPYLRERSNQLRCFERFHDMTRLENTPAYLKVSKFSSKAFGTRESYEWVCEGRFNYDCLVFMLRGQMKKLRSYKLNAVAKVFLGDSKVDISYDQIPVLYDGSDQDRSLLAWYCLKDAILPLDLLRQQMAIVNAVEQGRVTGVPIKWLLSRGQQIKTLSNVLRYKSHTQYVPTVSEEQNADFTSGGYVAPPKRGFYDVPIGTLDFQSLYPSIMVAYNLCYCTKVSLKHAFYALQRNDYWVPPRFTDNIETAYKLKEAGQDIPSKLLYGFGFVKKHIKEGILPRMLRELLATRKNVKKLLWWEKVAYTLVGAYMDNPDLTDENERKMDFIDSLKSLSKDQLQQKYNEHKIRHAVYDGRQLAVKVVCNSVYGFLKANMVTDKDLMESVTGWGRWMIGVSKDIAETHFTKANGYEFDAYVVYGDTDSIMVNFGDVSIQRCKQLSEECSAMCTERFVKPNLLEFETIKLTSLFINKKRYAAVEVEDVGDDETMEEALARGELTLKGLESKRRDNAPIQSKSQAKVIELLLRKRDLKAAEEFTKDTIVRIQTDEADMSEYVVTKGLSKTDKAYAKGGTKQQHVELAKRIRKRAKKTGELPPATGDRVPFVMVKGAKNSKAFERSEDPLFALKNKIPIDKDYYIEKLMYCLLRPFTAVYEPERCAEIKSNMPEKKLRTFKAVQKLFQGKHTRRRVQKVSSSIGLGAWAVVRPKCLGCGLPINAVKDGSANAAVCRSCAPNIAGITMQYQQKMDVEQAKYADYWRECQECVGSHVKVVTCANVNCHNFFRRTKVIIDIEDLAKKLERFQ